MHLILALAASHRWPDAPPPWPALPHLQRLLGQLQPAQQWREDDPLDPHPLLPHERVHARALGWPDDGPWPDAAARTGLDGPQAWLTPCHWQVGMDNVVMHNPADLALDDAESRTLMDSLQPWLLEDGLQLRWHDALHWHARGALLEGLATASLARVSGTSIRPWLMNAGLPGPLQRLQSEVQMLLYQHPVNEARQARGLPPVNSFWLHGAGTPMADALPRNEIHLETRLLQAGQRGDLVAWQQAWKNIDSTVLAPLCQQNTPLQLSLCSETTAWTWQRHASGPLGRLWRLWSRPNALQVLQQLNSQTA